VPSGSCLSRQPQNVLSRWWHRLEIDYSLQFADDADDMNTVIIYTGMVCAQIESAKLARSHPSWWTT
jgi:hypothetical protein